MNVNEMQIIRKETKTEHANTDLTACINEANQSNDNYFASVNETNLQLMNLYLLTNYKLCQHCQNFLSRG